MGKINTTDISVDLEAARAKRTPVLALRPHDDGTMDDFVAKRVGSVHAEQMDAGTLWVGIYFTNGERVTLNIHANKKNDLEYHVGEMPGDWIDLDALPHSHAIWREP